MVESGVPVIGQGTWEMEYDRRGTIAALRRGLDLGLIHVAAEREQGGDGKGRLACRVSPSNRAMPR